MGYADPNQIGTGLRQRLYSRAFIVADPVNPSDRFVYLVLDTQSGDTAVRYGILSGLEELGPDYAYYDHQNVAVTGTHSHSGPGAWLNYLLPQITSKGFDQQSYRAIVDGALLSIRRAHESLAPGYLSVGSTKVFGANINRSLYAYLANPEEERARYNISSEDDGSVEKDLTLLKFQRASDGKNIGVLTWFPTHGTSVLGNNTLVSGDNKGVAAYLFEKSVMGDDTAADGFVAGFSQANVGDTSPNVLGAWCEDGTGQMCSFENSTCSDEVETCPAALGYSFAAGTSDGPGAFDFTQHDGNPNTTSPVWRVVSGMLKEPSEEQKACHGPKPILLDVGEITSPYQWTPNVVDVQVFRVGQLVIIVSPGEATTMAGRRWKNAVRDKVTTLFAAEPNSALPVVVLGGPANSYTHYIATEEEYGIQRYEGASTLYGPHTLAAYINVTLSWVPYLSSVSSRPPRGPEPPDNSNRSLCFIPSVIHDATPFFKSFGDIVRDVKKVYRRGATVSASFVGANPRNNLRLEGSYAVVEQLDLTTLRWRTVRDDGDWHLVFRWRRVSELLGTSEVDISWETEPWAEPGRYRIKYFGDAKGFTGTITPFEGLSSEFEVVEE
ncbi:hypothetical protein DL765_006569 [Monosporascus sp. GIB2]|nr:hypothetical protein DL765_006569 [Monosporascus sp. GIB2]